MKITPPIHSSLVSPAFRRTAFLGLGISAIMLAGCSSTSSSQATTTTTGQDPDVTQVIQAATQQAEASGVKAADFTVTAKVSSANDSWMKFEVTATPAGQASNSFQSYYGYAHQTQKWNVIAIGTADVGCSTGTTGLSTSGSVAVPISVIQSFGYTCPGATG